jgi:hypothetical protein
MLEYFSSFLVLLTKIMHKYDFLKVIKFMFFINNLTFSQDSVPKSSDCVKLKKSFDFEIII